MAKRIVWTDQARADVRGIEQPIALQILKTLARYAQTGDGNTKQLRDVEPPLSASAPRITVSSSATKAITWKFPACSIARRLIAERGIPSWIDVPQWLESGLGIAFLTGGSCVGRSADWSFTLVPLILGTVLEDTRSPCPDHPTQGGSSKNARQKIRS